MKTSYIEADDAALNDGFNTASGASSAAKSKRRRTSQSHVVSTRVSADEIIRLEREAAGQSVSAYVRARLFGEAATPRQTRGKFPVKDYEALGRVLGWLGRSNISEDFANLEWAVDDGVVLLGPETERAIRQACADIAAMRADLVKALGLTAGPG